MKFEYNGNLLEKDRVLMVANEIIGKYLFVSFDKAVEAAMLEDAISSEKSNVLELNRLYNIMLVNKADRDILVVVFDDYMRVINESDYFEGIDVYIDLVDGICGYLEGICDFPYISDYK